MKLSASTLKVRESEPETFMDVVLRFELKPTTEQEVLLFHQWYLCRRLYNFALDERIQHYQHTGKGLSYRDQQNRLPKLKAVFPEYKGVYSQVLQDVLRRLDRAYINFFEKRSGYPRFKDKYRYRSMTLPQANAKRNFSRPDTLYFPKVGHLKMNVHQPFDPAQVKIINVKYQSGKWYANLTVERRCRSQVLSPDRAVGIDLGLTHLAVTSDGDQIGNPKWMRAHEKRIRKAARKLSRKKPGSNNRQNARQALQKQYDRVTNQRKDYLHKQSLALVKKYDVLCMEDLQVSRMMKNRRLSKSIASASWHRFVHYIQYKSKLQGKLLILVDPKHTTQQCSRCGERVKKPLSERVHSCPACDLVLDRDCNAAINIRNRGMKQIS